MEKIKKQAKKWNKAKYQEWNLKDNSIKVAAATAFTCQQTKFTMFFLSLSRNVGVNIQRKNY